MRPRLFLVDCPRCGREVFTLSRPLVSSEETHRKYAGICASCMTTDEQEALLHEQSDHLMRTLGRKGA